MFGEYCGSCRASFTACFTGCMVAIYRPLVGIGNMPAIVIIFIASFFPVLLTTVAGVKKIDREYLRIAENLEIMGNN